MRARRWRRVLTPCLGGLLLWSGAVCAQDQETAPVNRTWWLAGSLGAGAVSPDQDLADFRWATTPRSLFAAQLVVGRGRLAGGLRFSHWSTTQGTGLATGLGGQPTTADPEVRLQDLDLIAQLRMVRWRGWELWGTALAGRVRLSYTPDQLTITGGGGELTVNYAPLTETDLGLGLELRRGLGRRLNAAVAAERTGFALETDHRRGNEILTERQTFTNWNLRLQVAWIFDLG